MLKIRVPATTTNFGSGFDTFGLALDLYNTFIVDFSEKYEVEVEGYTSGIPKNEENLFIKVYKRSCEYFGFEKKPIKLFQKNEVPPARGLGSSATAIVGGIETAIALNKAKASIEDKLKVAFEFENHPDNIIPAFVGGFVVCATNGKTIFKKVEFPSELKLIFVILDYEVPTQRAREVLPETLSLKDTVFNVQRSALLIVSLLTKDYELLKEAVKDKIHQPYREKLVPGLSEAIEESYKLGALATFLSGAGPTVCSITLENEKIIGEGIREILEEKSGYKAQIKILRANNRGAETTQYTY